MTTSYETTELISSHHAEVERLSSELLDLGSRIAADDPEAAVLRERARALCWRLREHLNTESAALIADAAGDPQRIEEVMTHCHDEHERIDRAFARAEREARAPLELVQAVCSIARDARAHLDRAARA
jgi:hypothetical protein